MKGLIIEVLDTETESNADRIIMDREVHMSHEQQTRFEPIQFNLTQLSCTETGTKPKILKPTAHHPLLPSILFNREDFICSICEVFIEERKGVQLKNCKHEFCKTCLIDAIEHSNMVEIICPMMLVNCNAEIQDDEIKALLSPASYERRIVKSYQREIQSKHEERAFNTVPELLELENYDYVENKLQFQCGICLQDTSPGDGLILKNCLHEFCKICLAGTIEHTDEPEVPCPFVAEDGTHCEGTIQDRELRSVISAEVYNNHLQKSIAQAEATIKNSFHCKHPDCIGWVEIDNAQSFSCPVCKKINCIACKAIHEMKTCQEYFYEINADSRKARDDALTQQQVDGLITNRDAMNCPSCGVVLQKTTGCNHMTCRCGRAFNWTGK